jgi:ribosome-associated heat shock protein Hsp15
MPSSGGEGPALAEDRQRIDKWLWHARVVRTRNAAAGLATSGHVRINGQRIEAASRPVRSGDVVTVALDRIVRVLKVKAFAPRRGSSECARQLYDDLTVQDEPSSQARADAPAREPGSGRPTKRERRILDRFRAEEG